MVTNAINSGQYRIIDNLIEYSLDISEEMLNHIQWKTNFAMSSFTLNALRKEVKHLIDTYNFNYLKEVDINNEVKVAKLIKKAGEGKILEEQLIRDNIIKAEHPRRDRTIKEEQMRKAKEEAEYKIKTRRGRYTQIRNNKKR